MLFVGLILLYLAINKKFEPLLLVPIGFGTILSNIPEIGLAYSGLEKIIDQNLKAPNIIDLITSRDIYIPLTIFISLILLTIFLRRLFYKK